MTWATTWQFFKHWMLFTVRDTIAQLFGWLAIAGGIVDGFLPAIGIPLVPRSVSNTLITVSIGAAIGFVVYLLIGFVKAYRHIHPLVVSVTDDLRSPDFAFNERARGYSAAVIVRNRSEAHLMDCIVYVVNAPQTGDEIAPRFVEKFDLPPRSRKVVYFAYWFSRELPNVDDKNIGLSGPPSGCFDGNICRTQTANTILHLQVGSAETGSVELRCRIWIDVCRETAARAPGSDSIVVPMPFLWRVRDMLSTASFMVVDQ